MKKTLVVIIVFSVLAAANVTYASKTRVKHAQCGNASVKVAGIVLAELGGHSGYYTYEKVTLTAQTAGKRIVLNFSDEHFDAACIVSKKDNKPYIVFQSHCAGNGIVCDTIWNYGIIDAQTLKVLLMPDATTANTRKATRILGTKPPMLFEYKARFF
jgi:hypothetical protein